MPQHIAFCREYLISSNAYQWGEADSNTHSHLPPIAACLKSWTTYCTSTVPSMALFPMQSQTENSAGDGVVF